MTFRPCFVIPIYNHKDTIAATVRGLCVHDLPIYVVDDGSDEATREALLDLARATPLMRLDRLAANRGKGAAVMHGLRLAHRAGHTHAVQIDADGQHDLDDVPRFLAAGKASPQAIVCGRPVYDASVPRSRLYGRYITHVWVWIETLSLDIKDSMCGYRLYPLAATLALIDGRRIAERMAFDIEILVRLAWAGIPVVNIPTRVIYPENGLSHFDVLRDNLNISRVHARLFFGMLARLPVLLWRKLAPARAAVAGPRHWSRAAERGSYFGMLLLHWAYRVFGRGAVRLMLHPVVGYFFLTGHAARRASGQYLRRLHEHTQPRPVVPAPTWRDSYAHMLSFAESCTDKWAAWVGELDHARVVFPQRDDLLRLTASGKGALIIGSHLGNLEMCRALAAAQGHRGVNAVVYTQHAQRFNALLDRANQAYRLNLIQVSSLGPDTAILLHQKIEQGELIVIVGDRTPPAENGRVSEVEFLGFKAPFAQGPFLLAASLECPVYLFFCLREGEGYRIHFEHFADRILLPRPRREEALREYMQRYALRLEAYCRRAPYQWFNFFDFWHAGRRDHPT